jgi:hypothetical protein
MFGLQAFKVVAKSYEVLAAQARPGSDQPEVIPWYFFHRRTYTSGTTVSLVFFDAVETDESLGNMQLASALPTPEFLEVYSVHMDVLQRITNAADANPPTGALDNVEQLRRSGRGIWRFVMSGKTYGQFPLTAVGPPGNPIGLMTGVDNVAAGGTPSVAQHAGWAGHFGTGDPLITIPPTTSFRVQTTWPAAVTLTGDQIIEVGLWGALHRKVV